MSLTDMARNNQFRLINTMDEWGYETSNREKKMFEPKVNEIILAHKQSGELEFQLFLKCYNLDFEKMIQTNEETKFERPVKKEMIGGVSTRLTAQKLNINCKNLKYNPLNKRINIFEEMTLLWTLKTFKGRAMS